MRLTDQALRGRTVIAADGRAVGTVEGLTLDVIENTPGQFELATLATLRVELRREIEVELGLERKRFRTTVIEMPFTHVQSIGDAVVLSIPVSVFRTLLGPAEEAAPAAPPPQP